MAGWTIPYPVFLFWLSCCILGNRGTLWPSNRAKHFSKLGLEKNPAEKNRVADKVATFDYNSKIGRFCGGGSR